MTPMCNTTTGVFEGWAIGTADCEGVIALEYFDEDGISAGTTLPITWKPCVQGEVGPEWTPTHETKAYAAVVNIDFTTAEYKSISLTGDLQLTGSGYAAPLEMVIRIVADATIRALTFPAGWKFVGSAAPANIAANKTGKLTLTAFGPAEANVVAVWEVQP